MSRQSTPQAASARPQRVPLSARNRLSIKNKKDGYTYRIVNDVEDRVERLLEAGYEIVPEDEVGSVGDKRVDSPTSLGSASSISVGKGTRAIVMRQRDEWYKEDQLSKQAAIDEIEQTMHGNAQKASDYGEFSFKK